VTDERPHTAEVISLRLVLAKNPNTSETVLLDLADDKDPEIRFAVAMNPGATSAVLAKLAKDIGAKYGSWLAFTSIANHPHTPPDVRLAAQKAASALEKETAPIDFLGK